MAPKIAEMKKIIKKSEIKFKKSRRVLAVPHRASSPALEPTTLPCGHAFCTACVVELRAKGVSETCPLCRAALPPGPEKLYELAMRVR